MKLIQLLDKQNIDINNKLLKELSTFKIKWMVRNKKGFAEHIDFLSSDLIGVYPVMFSKDDVLELFDILDIDYKALKKDIKRVSDINPEFRNITEPVYVIMLYIMYRVNIGKFSTKVKEEMRVVLVNIFIYKMVSSILHHYYGNYNVDMNNAILTREKLHGNSLLSKLGSWNNVINHFTIAITEDGLHSKRLRKNFKTNDLTYIISNTKTSINSFVYNSNLILLHIKEDESNHTLNKSYAEGSDGAIMQDHKNIHKELMRVSSLLLATGDFRNNDVIDILYTTYLGLDRRDLVNGIEIIEELHRSDTKELNNIIDLLFETTIYYLYIDKLHPPYTRSILQTISYLKNYYTSSRVKDKRLTKVKKYITKAMKKRITSNNRRSTGIANTVMVYIFILGNIELHSYK